MVWCGSESFRSRASNHEMAPMAIMLLSMPILHAWITGHYREITWVSWRLELLATRLFGQQLVWVNNKENIKAPNYRPFVRRNHKSLPCGFSSQRACNTETISMSQCHHVTCNGTFSAHRANNMGKDTHEIFSSCSRSALIQHAWITTHWGESPDQHTLHTITQLMSNVLWIWDIEQKKIWKIWCFIMPGC